MTGWSLTIAMKKSKFTETQIVFALKQAETGTAVAEVCRKLGISEATFYSWKKKYGGLDPAELRRLRQLEEENAQLKRIVADLTLDKQMLQDVLKKSSEGAATKTAGAHAVDGVSRLGATCLCDAPKSVYFVERFISKSCVPFRDRETSEPYICSYCIINSLGSIPAKDVRCAA